MRNAVIRVRAGARREAHTRALAYHCANCGRQTPYLAEVERGKPILWCSPCLSQLPRSAA